jgi:hypothetical protein
VRGRLPAAGTWPRPETKPPTASVVSRDQVTALLRSGLPDLCNLAWVGYPSAVICASRRGACEATLCRFAAAAAAAATSTRHVLCICTVHARDVPL